MPEDKHFQLLQPTRTSDQKKKKKKKVKKATTSTTNAENAEKPQASLPPASLLPPQSLVQLQDQLPSSTVTSKKSADHLAASGRRSKKLHKDSPGLQLTHKTRGGGDLAQGHVTELCVQAQESLRWEGELQDPQAEAKRLEQYRANRRQRYFAHREALLKETHDALRQTLTKEHREKQASAESDQQETASLTASLNQRRK